jgi:hypothetical protein
MPRHWSGTWRKFIGISGYDYGRIGIDDPFEEEATPHRVRRMGAIARRVAELLQARNDNIAVVGIATWHAPKHDQELSEGTSGLMAPSDLPDLAPDLVVEAASRAAVEHGGLASLRCAPASP